MTIKISIPENINECLPPTSIVDARSLDIYTTRFDAVPSAFNRISQLYGDSGQRGIRIVSFHDRTTPGYPSLMEHLNTSTRIEDVDHEFATDSAVLELRRRSGLSWKELALLFDVPRQVVCDWASGDRLDEEQREIVLATLEAVLYVDKGNSDATRAYLLTTADDLTPSIFELLRARRFAEVKARPRSNFASSRWRRSLSREAADARRPAPPAVLLQAKQSRPSFRTSPRLAEALQVPADNE